MEALAGSERRRHTRKKVEVQVLLGCGKSPAKGERVAVYDISLSGMAIYPGPLQLELNERLCLCFAHHEQECSADHVIEATVVHTHGGIVGMRFDTVGVSILEDIHRLLRDERIFQQATV